MNRFFKIGTQQQRHIANYRGAGDNYDEYLNYSVFPSTSYYVEEKMVKPDTQQAQGDLSTLPDTVRIQTCLNFDFREELSDLVDIMNDPGMYHGKIKVTAVSNDEIGRATTTRSWSRLRATGTTSCSICTTSSFVRPTSARTASTSRPRSTPKGKQVIDDLSFAADKNFFRIDLAKDSPENADVNSCSTISTCSCRPMRSATSSRARSSSTGSNRSSRSVHGSSRCPRSRISAPSSTRHPSTCTARVAVVHGGEVAGRKK